MMSGLRIWILGICMGLFALCANTANAAQTILIVGDSLSAGYGIDKTKSWPTLLSAQFSKNRQQVTIVNESISGETAAGAARRIDALLEQYQPSVVIIELGANDGLKGTPIARIKQNLSRIIDSAKKTYASVLLIGMQLPPNYGERYSLAFHQLFGDLAKAKDIALVPFLFKDIMTKPDMFQSDNLHPTEKAQPILLNTIYPALKPLLKTAKK